VFIDAVFQSHFLSGFTWGGNRERLNKAPLCCELLLRIVKTDKKFLRPAEVDCLVGDASKAKKILGWKPKINFQQLVKMMVDSDMELIEKEANGKRRTK